MKAKNIPSNTACLLCAYFFVSEAKDSCKKPDPADSAPACLDSQLQKGQWKALDVSYIFRTVLLFHIILPFTMCLLQCTMAPKCF